jgi:hypothetical protein
VEPEREAKGLKVCASCEADALRGTARTAHVTVVRVANGKIKATDAMVHDAETRLAYAERFVDPKGNVTTKPLSKQAASRVYFTP